jgi:hypothetical protein
MNVFRQREKCVPLEHSWIYIVVQIFEYLGKGKVKEGLGGFLPAPATIEVHPIAKLAVKDPSYFPLALYVGIINTHKRCERVYAYRTVREGKIVFFRNGFGTVLKSNISTWSAGTRLFHMLRSFMTILSTRSHLSAHTTL